MALVKECKYCTKDWAKVCKERHPKTNYGCTREEGHKGPHVACGTMSHSIKRWKQKK